MLNLLSFGIWGFLDDRGGIWGKPSTLRFGSRLAMRQF